ncbi:hypothetical protein QR680_005674 [Steinernema hermaphroditum]|uniref:Uncharacterized protein n=1 Tax=Steinernema hermaphroditum TaxID=289476 RepID=A0AA39LVB7_9BILA|nr:hypothetical protein QR680_005674 [Steinernema hermaphroditum]
MAFLDQVKQGFAKAIQIASDNQVFHDLPECSLLSNVEVLSIKLKDPERHSAVGAHLANATARSPVSASRAHFDPVEFLVRNERNHKNTILTGELTANQGIVVRTNTGKQLMTATIPNNSPDCLGKIVHPHHVTLYKASRTPFLGGTPFQIKRVVGPIPSFAVMRTGTEEPFIKIEKVLVSLYPIGKALGLLGTDCVYWFKRADGTILGYVRPKLAMKHNTLIVKFSSTAKDSQVRAAILGTALLFGITEAHPHLRRQLEESMVPSDF